MSNQKMGAWDWLFYFFLLAFFVLFMLSIYYMPNPILLLLSLVMASGAYVIGLRSVDKDVY